MTIYDVTIPLSSDTPVYPGDPPVNIEQKMSISNGDLANVSYYGFSSHAGTHVDPPSHLIDNGLTVDELLLELLIGRATVIEIKSPCIDKVALGEVDLTATVRVLFKTSNSQLWNKKEFIEDYVYIAPDAAQMLVDSGIKLVGIDYLSVDKFDSAKLPSHITLLNNGVVIIEGLNLAEIEPGDYELICLPLKIKGGDGAPARVILRR